MVKIMVDSSADRQSEQYDYFIPLKVNIDGKEYRSGLDIDSDTFYDLLVSASQFPQTSQPSTDDFLRCFEQIRDNGDSIIYFAISSELSGTYQGACIAKEMTGYDDIYIIDTKTVTHMLGILADYAKDLVSQGLSASQIAEKCESLKGKIKVIAGVDTLEYLRRGGRLSGASAVVGKIANIKPVITVSEEGRVEVIGKTIGVGRAVNFITEKVKSFDIDSDFPVYSLYTMGEENCLTLEKALKNTGISIDKRMQVGSVIGAHVGPGVYGVCFVTK